MVCRCVQTRTRSSNIIEAWSHKCVGSVTVGRHLEIARKGTRESILGTCKGELGSDRRRRYMVSIKYEKLEIGKSTDYTRKRRAWKLL